MRYQIKESKSTTKIRSFLLYYCILWIVASIAFFWIKVNMKIVTEEELADWGAVYFVFSGGLGFICNIFEGSRLYDYLKKYHNHKWIQLTTVWGHPGGTNSFRELGFIFSRDYLNDPIVLKLKNQQKQVLLFEIIAFFSTPVVLVGVLSM